MCPSVIPSVAQIVHPYVSHMTHLSVSLNRIPPRSLSSVRMSIIHSIHQQKFTVKGTQEYCWIEFPESATPRKIPFCPYIIRSVCQSNLESSIHSTTGRILDFCTFIPFLQYVQLVFPRCLCTGNRGFGSEGIKLVKMPLLR